MAGVQQEPSARSPDAGGSARERRAAPSQRRELLSRVLALREGSIIVVTVIVAVYFSVNTSSFFTGSNFKTLLPYFAPFAILAAGEVFVMILGEIDLSIGAMYLFAPFLFYKLSTAGIALVPSVIIALLTCMAVGLANGIFVLCSLTAGLVGIFEAVRAASIQPDPAGANEILFLAVAAGVIGGTLLTGGSGTIVGALIGALFLGILKDGLILQGVNANYLLFYTGLAIIVAMTVNVYVQRARRGQGTRG